MTCVLREDEIRRCLVFSSEHVWQTVEPFKKKKDLGGLCAGKMQDDETNGRDMMDDPAAVPGQMSM